MDEPKKRYFIEVNASSEYTVSEGQMKSSPVVIIFAKGDSLYGGGSVSLPLSEAKELRDKLIEVIDGIEKNR